MILCKPEVNIFRLPSFFSVLKCRSHWICSSTDYILVHQLNGQWQRQLSAPVPKWKSSKSSPSILRSILLLRRTSSASWSKKSIGVLKHGTWKVVDLCRLSIVAISTQLITQWFHLMKGNIALRVLLCSGGENVVNQNRTGTEIKIGDFGKKGKLGGRK